MTDRSSPQIPETPDPAARRLPDAHDPFREAWRLYRGAQIDELEAELARMSADSAATETRAGALAWSLWLYAWQCRFREATELAEREPELRNHGLVQLASAFLLTRLQQLSEARKVLSGLARQAGGSELRAAAVQTLLSYVCIEAGDWAGAHRSLAEAGTLLARCEASPLHASCTAMRVYVQVLHGFYSGRIDQALEGTETLEKLLRETEDPYLGAELHNVRGALLVELGHYRRGEEEQLRALQLQRKIRSREEEINSYLHLGELRWWQGQTREAMDWFLHCKEECEASGLKRSGHLWGLGICHLQMDEYAKARALLDEGYKIARQTGRQVWRHRIQAALAECAFRSSDQLLLTSLLADLESLAQAVPGDEVAAATAWVSYLRHTLLEDSPAAERSLSQFYDRVLTIENPSLAIRFALQGAILAVELPDVAHAERFAELARRRLESITPDTGDFRLIPQKVNLHWVAGVLAHRRGDHSASESEFRAGLVKACHHAHLPFLEAKLREQLAATLCETDRLDEAEEMLQLARAGYRKVENWVPLTYWTTLARFATRRRDVLQEPSGREPRVDTVKLFDGKILLAGPRLRDTLHVARQYSRAKRPILLLGESGVGKEYLARYIHTVAGPEKPFVAVGSWTERGEMFLTRLFGHVKGAFTGANADRKGAVELAGDGTLFLDEIHNCPEEHQGALLRFLREGEYSRVGSDEIRHARCRIIAATNEPLEKLRHDFAVRLVLSIDIPPLRDRREEIPDLVRLFLRLHQQKSGEQCTIQPSAIANLAARPWPLNIAELENVVTAAILRAPDGIIDEAVIQTVCGDSSGAREAKDKRQYADLRTHEAAYIQAVLSEEPNISTAARILGISRTTLYKKIQDYDIHAGEP